MSTEHERRRDALLAAVLPAPGRGLPAFAALSLSGFWARFAEVAPLHLRLGLAVAVVVVGGVLPRLLGLAGPVETLDDDARETLVSRAGEEGVLGPLVRPLLDVLKVVACLAYFSDPGVEATVRGRAS